jgi:hypothetical protein
VQTVKVLCTGRREGGWAAVLQHPNQNCKSTRFLEIIKSAILHDLLFSRNKPENPDYDQYTGIFKNKRRTYDEVNKIKNKKLLNFFISIR